MCVVRKKRKNTPLGVGNTGKEFHSHKPQGCHHDKGDKKPIYANYLTLDEQFHYDSFSSGGSYPKE